MVGKQILLNPSLEAEISDIVKEVSTYIEDQSKSGSLNPEYYCPTLLFASEILPYIENQDTWIHIGYMLCKEIKGKLEKCGYHPWPAMFRELGYQCFAVQTFCKQTNILEDFSHSLNKLLFIAANNRIEKIKDDDTRDRNYDLISGIAGTVYYLLDCDYSQEEKQVLMKCIEYLLELTKDKEFGNQTLINFHIFQSNQDPHFDQEDFKNGSINFGLAHGMLGPLIALAKAYASGFRTDGIREGIEKIYHLYETFQSIHEESIPLWPDIITVQEYVKGTGNPEHLHLRSSWCYGNLGIIRGLQKVCGYMDWKELEHSYTEALKRFYMQELEDYNLDSPSLCHGFSSLVAIQTCAYYDDQDPQILINIERNVRQVISAYRKSNEHEVNLVEIINMTSQVEGYLEDLNLLTGSIGVAIALLSVRGQIGIGKLLMID